MTQQVLGQTLSGLRRQTRLDVAQALAMGDLGKSHHLVLRGAGQRPHGAVAFMARDDLVERAPRQEIHELREQPLAGVHGRVLPARSSGRATTRSNPPQQRFAKNPYASAASTQFWFSEPDTSGGN